MPKYTLTKFLLPAVAALTFASTANSHTLPEAVGHAVATGPDTLISVSNREAIDQDLKRSYAGYLPSVDLNAGYGRENSDNVTTRGPLGVDGSRTLWRTEFGVMATQMLFDGFGVKNDVEGNMARVRASAWRVNHDAENIALRVAEAFLDVNKFKELVHWAKINVEAHQKIYGQIQKRSEGGIGRKADLDQAEGRLAFARSNLLAEQANLRDAETEYLRSVGLPPIELTQPEPPTVGFPETERSAIALGLNNHPELRASVSDVAVAKSRHRGARAPYFPRVDLELGLTRNYNIDGSRGDNDDWQAMLRGRWNVFRGGADVARVRETASRVQEAQEVRNRAHRQVTESVRLSWSTFVTAKSQMRHRKVHMHASERTRDAYQKQFNIGQRTLLDVLDSEAELFASRSNYVTSQYQELIGRYRVLNSTGALLDHLAVAYPVAADPSPKGIFHRDHGYG